MSRKRNRRMQSRPANCFYLENLLFNNRTPDPAEVLRLMNVVLVPYQRLLDGVGSEEDVIQLGLVVNTGCVRARAVGQLLVDAFQNAGEALIRCEDRMRTHGCFGFDGPGVNSMNAAMDLYHDLLTLSSVKQMHEAEQEARRLMFSNAPQTT
jgi:hypothetical protein